MAEFLDFITGTLSEQLFVAGIAANAAEAFQEIKEATTNANIKKIQKEILAQQEIDVAKAALPDEPEREFFKEIREEDPTVREENRFVEKKEAERITRVLAEVKKIQQITDLPQADVEEVMARDLVLRSLQLQAQLKRVR